MKLLYLPRNKPLENIELVGRLKKLPWAIYRSTKKQVCEKIMSPILDTSRRKGENFINYFHS